MTIKQQGGIFGRNPTFNDVEVEGNLTVGGSPISAGGTMASQDADSVNIDGGAIDGVTLGTNSPVTNAEINTILIESDGNDLKFYRTDPTINAGNGIGFLDFGGSDDGDYPRAAYMFAAAGTQNWGVGTSPTKLVFGTCSRFNSTPRDVAVMTEEGDLSLPIGSLIVSSGQGIDFSATSGTGTSELFDDYEEGTWTPAFDDTGGVTYTFQNGTYVKIGRAVHVNGGISWTTFTPSGNVRLGGLPYASVSGYNGLNTLNVVLDSNNTAFDAVQEYIQTGIMFFRSNTVSASTNPYGSSGTIYISGVYYTS